MKITKNYLRQLIRESLTGIDAPEKMSDEDYADLKASNQLRGASPVGDDAAFESIKLAVSRLSNNHKRMIFNFLKRELAGE